MDSSYLREAVHQHRAWSMVGLSERLFTLWFGGFVYNQIWEDPRVDLKALQLDANSRVLTIASGGCNVLNYLCEQPAHITAIDLNRHHMYLTRLKLEALRRLPTHDDFFRFFGVAQDEQNLTNYLTHIRDHLDDATRKFWQSRRGWRMVTGPRIRYFRRNFYNHAKFGRLMRVGHTIAKVIGRDPMRLLKATSLQEQEQIYNETIGPVFDHWMVRGAGKLPLVAFSLGIPPRQVTALRGSALGIVDVYRERARRLTCDFPVSDNYFTWQAISQRYDTQSRQALPEYLQERNWQTLRDNLHRVSTHVTSFGAFLAKQEDASYDRFVLLDAQDWMTDGQIANLWSEIDRVGRPGTRIIFRTAAADSPIEKALPAELYAKFHYHRQMSESLFAQDRSAIYGGFHVYSKH